MNIDADIRNFYEQLVLEELGKRRLGEVSSDFLSDVTCLALNQLPAKYIRHSVDMAYYLSPSERAAMETRTREAVERAIAYFQQQN